MVYIKEGDSLSPRGQAFMVEDQNVEYWLARKLDGTDVVPNEGESVLDARKREEELGVVFKYKVISEEEYNELCKKE